MTLLRVQNLCKRYGTLSAINDVSFELAEGETLGLVGESGSGKSTLASLICALDKPTSGTVLTYETKIQMVFQDPYGALDPRQSAIDTVTEAFIIQKKPFAKHLALELLIQLGITAQHFDKVPHELSGGLRQRVCIARALAASPKLLVLDEPLSSLDICIQAQIVELLKKIQKEQKIAYLFISHDLSMVRYFCDKIGVLYQGKLVEIQETEKLFTHPNHPYTQKLLNSMLNSFKTPIL